MIPICSYFKTFQRLISVVTVTSVPKLHAFLALQLVIVSKQVRLRFGLLRPVDAVPIGWHLAEQ